MGKPHQSKFKIKKNMHLSNESGKLGVELKFGIEPSRTTIKATQMWIAPPMTCNSTFKKWISKTTNQHFNEWISPAAMVGFSNKTSDDPDQLAQLGRWWLMDLPMGRTHPVLTASMTHRNPMQINSSSIWLVFFPEHSWTSIWFYIVFVNPLIPSGRLDRSCFNHRFHPSLSTDPGKLRWLQGSCVLWASDTGLTFTSRCSPAACGGILVWQAPELAATAGVDRGPV